MTTLFFRARRTLRRPDQSLRRQPGNVDQADGRQDIPNNKGWEQEQNVGRTGRDKSKFEYVHDVIGGGRPGSSPKQIFPCASKRRQDKRKPAEEPAKIFTMHLKNLDQG